MLIKEAVQAFPDASSVLRPRHLPVLQALNQKEGCAKACAVRCKHFVEPAVAAMNVNDMLSLWDEVGARVRQPHTNPRMTVDTAVREPEELLARYGQQNICRQMGLSYAGEQWTKFLRADTLVAYRFASTQMGGEGRSRKIGPLGHCKPSCSAERKPTGISGRNWIMGAADEIPTCAATAADTQSAAEQRVTYVRPLQRSAWTRYLTGRRLPRTAASPNRRRTR